MTIIKKKIQLCPICKSEDLVMWAGNVTGEYLCKNCGYKGAFIIEKEVSLPVIGEARTEDEKTKSDKGHKPAGKPKRKKAR
ncbi:MAG: TFIIB-type zinc ribbon-containing protein [DPANN group archaeon]|nr:TFIIB-type zinc ribbon-containing protein [DPANN group archaeon]